MTIFTEHLGDPNWWGDAILNWLIFSVIITVMLWWRQKWLDRNFTNWRVQFNGSKDADIPLSISDAREIISRSLSGWQLIKSCISNRGTTSTAFFDEAEKKGWLKIPPSHANKNRVIIIDFDKLQASGQFRPHKSGNISPGVSTKT